MKSTKIKNWPAQERPRERLRLGRSYFQSNARGAVGMWKIGAEDIRNFPIPVPPLEVQRNIVDMVNRQQLRIDELRKEAEKLEVITTREVEEMNLGNRPVEGGQATWKKGANSIGTMGRPSKSPGNC